MYMLGFWEAATSGSRTKTPAPPHHLAAAHPSPAQNSSPIQSKATAPLHCLSPERETGETATGKSYPSPAPHNPCRQPVTPSHRSTHPPATGDLQSKRPNQKNPKSKPTPPQPPARPPQFILSSTRHKPKSDRSTTVRQESPESSTPQWNMKQKRRRRRPAQRRRGRGEGEKGRRKKRTL
ncbi:unnamed protein product [Rhodiola kirilowii]